MSAPFQGFFPVDPVSGQVQFVLAAYAQAPFTFQNALKLDAQGNVVVVLGP